jgi:HK97 family phage portal protein
MSLFRGERRNFSGAPDYNPFERPSMPLQSLALDGILGSGQNNDSGETVDPLRGLGIPTAYRCVSIISTVVASCALEEIDKNGAATTWTDWLNLQSYTPFEMTEIIVTHLAGWGNFFAFKVTRGLTLLDLQPIFPGNVHVLRINGVKTYRVRKQTDVQGNGAWWETGSGQYTDYTDDEVFHIPFLGYDGLQGMSPIMANAQTFGTTIAADRLAARFHSRGQQLGGIVKVKAPLASQSQADAIKLRWRSSHGGTRNSGDVAVLDAETDFQNVTINPNELQLIEARGWQMQEVARVYGVPLTMLSSESTGYGDAIETQQIGFVAYTLKGYTTRTEQRLARDFTPRGRTLYFNLDNAVRGTLLERFQAYNEGIAGGWLVRSEARGKENMTELPAKFGLDEPLIPQSLNGQIVMPNLATAEQNAAEAAAQAPSNGSDSPQDDTENTNAH